MAIHELIVELGDRLYRVERPFGSWPLNTGFVTDVAVDPRGHVFVMLRHDPLVHPNDPRVIELAPDGAYLGGLGRRSDRRFPHADGRRHGAHPRGRPRHA